MKLQRKIYDAKEWITVLTIKSIHDLELEGKYKKLLQCGLSFAEIKNSNIWVYRIIK